MAIRKFKPTTPGTRNKAISAFDEITAKKPYKALLEPLKSTGGRNNTGQMTFVTVVADTRECIVSSTSSAPRTTSRLL